MSAYIITLDTGLNLGVAVWENLGVGDREDLLPVETGCITFSKPKDWFGRTELVVKAYGKLLEKYGSKHIKVYAEYPTYFEGNHTASAGGSLGKLHTMFGALAAETWSKGSTFKAVEVMWKGQLTKEACDIRTARRVGRAFLDTVKTDHARDAVSIGLFVRGYWGGIPDISIQKAMADVAPWEEDKLIVEVGGTVFLEKGTRLCVVCKCPQFKTPSGPVCKNGHGGADSVKGIRRKK